MNVNTEEPRLKAIYSNKPLTTSPQQGCISLHIYSFGICNSIFHSPSNISQRRTIFDWWWSFHGCRYGQSVWGRSISFLPWKCVLSWNISQFDRNPFLLALRCQFFCFQAPIYSLLHTIYLDLFFAGYAVEHENRMDLGRSISFVPTGYIRCNNKQLPPYTYRLFGECGLSHLSFSQRQSYLSEDILYCFHHGIFYVRVHVISHLLRSYNFSLDNGL